MTFSVRKAEFENEIYSLWNIGGYPEGDYINFQVWGGTVSQVANIANHIIDSFVATKPLRSNKLKEVVPTVFVKEGAYANGKLTLTVVNKSRSANMQFVGNLRATEQAEEVNTTKTVALSGAYNQQVTIDTGYLFDIGFSIKGAASSQIDALYLADGPWGIDHAENGVVVNDFVIGKNENAKEDNKHIVERNATVRGEVKETLNLFRNVMPGDLSLDVTPYEAVQFEMFNTRDIEVILVTEGLQDWSNRLRYTIPATDQKKSHSIAFADFVDGNDQPGIIEKVKSVVFSVQGDYQNFYTFELEVSALAFGKIASNEEEDDDTTEEEEEEEEEEDEEVIAVEEDTFDPNAVTQVKNYPNPFISETTIQIPGEHQEVLIEVIDMVGRTVRKEYVAVNRNTIRFETRNLTPGIYHYMIRGQQMRRFKGRLFIKETN